MLFFSRHFKMIIFVSKTFGNDYMNLRDLELLFSVNYGFFIDYNTPNFQQKDMQNKMINIFSHNIHSGYFKK
eukprot:UN10018